MSNSLLLSSQQVEEFNAVSDISINFFNVFFQTIAVLSVLLGAIFVICLLVYQNSDGQLSLMSMIWGIAGVFIFICLFSIFLI